MCQGEACRNTLDQCLTVLPWEPDAVETQPVSLATIKDIICSAIISAIYHPERLPSEDFKEED